MCAQEHSVKITVPTCCVIRRSCQLLRVCESRVYEYGGLDIGTESENRSTRRKACPSASLSSVSPKWIHLESNPFHRGDRSATKHLITALPSGYHFP